MSAEIAVLAGTGKSGRRVAAALRADGHPVRVASRRAEVRFDWTDDRTWPAVLDGAGGVYLVAPDDPAPVPPFVAAAERAGLERVVLLSGRGSEAWHGRFGRSMAAAEDAVRGSGLRWTVVRPNNFMQNFTEDLFHAPLLAGRLALPADGVPEPFVDLDDVAAVVARLLTADGHAGRTYDLSGPTALTFAQAVATIAAAAGRPIRYETLTPDAYAAELRAGGLGEWAAELNGMFAIMAEGHIAAPAGGVEEVLGLPPRSFADWVARTAPTGVWTPGGLTPHAFGPTTSSSAATAARRATEIVSARGRRWAIPSRSSAAAQRARMSADLFEKK
ncbi:NmrA family NAD(P)-binding protein [Pseudonocardia nigra]|uniref:NmrA family NAD(P)-binding protein n=1 Tax=Pseudonocardia nigra TaxID=1921578 RepID=UPI001C5FBA20|nr:NAD(P)H-binding protein [Pseudonocardia nigra]